jgi:hypothetical protein
LHGNLLFLGWVIGDGLEGRQSDISRILILRFSPEIAQFFWQRILDLDNLASEIWRDERAKTAAIASSGSTGLVSASHSSTSARDVDRLYGLRKYLRTIFTHNRLSDYARMLYSPNVRPEEPALLFPAAPCDLRDILSDSSDH